MGTVFPGLSDPVSMVFFGGERPCWEGVSAWSFLISETLLTWSLDPVSMVFLGTVISGLLWVGSRLVGFALACLLV